MAKGDEAEEGASAKRKAKPARTTDLLLEPQGVPAPERPRRPRAAALEVPEVHASACRPR